MMGNYVLSVEDDGKVLTYLYPIGRDFQCMADAMIALMGGHRVMIEPPEGVTMKRGWRDRVRD